MRSHLVLLIGAVLGIGAVAAAAEEEQVLPRNMTILEQLSAQEGATTGEGFYIWECFPEIAGFTDPPPKTSRFPTEGEQSRGVVYGWPSYGAQMSPLTELIRNSVQQDGYETTVIVSSTYRALAENTLRSRGFDDEMISRINWFIAPLNGIWIRDYGPEILVTPDGDFQFVDMGYYSGQFLTCPSVPDQIPVGRPSDDVSPTRWAPNFLKGVDVFRPQIRTEGGNLQTDGQGTCVHMQRDVLGQNRFSRWFYSPDELDDVYRAFYNCARVITLESLRPDPQFVGYRTNIDHVDMFMAFQSARTVIVARLDPEDAEIDPTNAAILDRNAQRMSEAGYDVVRIPQPARYCTVYRGNNCIANPGETRECAEGAGVGRVWATYANTILIGNRMLMPVYRDPISDSSPLSPEVKERIKRQEAEAIDTYQTVLDAEYGVGAITVVPVVSDDMIPCLGAIHCISMTYGPPPVE